MCLKVCWSQKFLKKWKTCSLNPKTESPCASDLWPNDLKTNTRSQCYKTLIYCHSTVMPSFCVIKQYYVSNYHGMAVSNTMVIYRGISTLETTSIFITLALNYHGIWTIEKVGFLTAVIYHGKLPWYFYNIGSRGQSYKTFCVCNWWIFVLS